MVYLILAQICLTVGTPMWAVYLSYAGAGILFVKGIAKGIKKVIENNEE